MQAVAPAIEVAEQLVAGTGLDELAALDARGRVHRLVEVQRLRRRYAVAAEVAGVGHADVHARDTSRQHVALDLVDHEAWRERGDAEVHLGLARDHGGELVQRWVPDADARVDAADLDAAELRVIERTPRREAPALVLVAVPPREPHEVVARDLIVVLHELLRSLHAEAVEQVPQLDHVRERAALVVRVVAEVAAQRLVGLVEELVEAAHRRVAGVRGHPRLELAEQREVLLIHLGVGRVTRRPDQHAAERVVVAPREDLGMLGRELDDAARFRLARGVRAGTGLLVVRGPRPREVAVEIDRVVAEEMRRRDPLAIEVLDRTLRIHLVERSGVLERALDEQPGKPGGVDELAGRIEHAHRERETVAVDVAGDPARRAAVHAVVARHAAHAAAGAQHGLGSIGRDPRHDIEQHVAQALDDRGRQVERLGVEVETQRVLGDRERDARSCELARVDVAVGPGRRADAIGLRPDRDQPHLAALGGLRERRQSRERGIGVTPGAELARELIVIEVVGAKAERQLTERGCHGDTNLHRDRERDRCNPARSRASRLCVEQNCRSVRLTCTP